VPDGHLFHRKEEVIMAAEKSFEERAAKIKENPLYGVIVCRCMDVSEGEIMDAIHRTLGARSLDGIKRRVHQGMGRCQAGFCTSKTMEILSRETGIPMEKICKNSAGSEMLAKKM
jgi:glycerol-3-phosphate dehydrogenase